MAKNKMKAAICITGYNEQFSQLVLSIAGVFRNYYELVQKDRSYEGRVTVVIVYDGYPAFNKIKSEKGVPLTETLTKVGLYDEQCAQKYFRKFPTSSGDQISQFSDLIFMDRTNDSRVQYETHNIAHSFSRTMTFLDLMEGLTHEEQEEMIIDGYNISDFMTGSSEPK
jgi:hypothetical protein